MGVVIKDPAVPQNVLFSIIKISPLFESDAGKQYWLNYIFPGGSRLPGIEMPVVNPFTPENFLMKFGQAAQTNYLKNYQLPVFEKVYIVSSEPVNVQGANAKTMRAVFDQNGKATEGLFFVSLLADTSGVSDLGTAYFVTGITGDVNKFDYMQKSLAESLGSISINPQYVSSCNAQSQAIANGASEASKSLSATSDTIMSAWEDRQQSDNRIAQKWGDYDNGYERLYSPSTGYSYNFESGFYEGKYNQNRNSLQMNDLQLVTSVDSSAYDQPAYDGPQNLH